MGRLVIILVLVLLLQARGATASECSCLNGGGCNPWGAKRSCSCLPGFVGRNCKTRAVAASEEAERVALSSDYSYLYFSPKERNYFKLIIEICMLHNPSARNSVLYLQTKDEEGGWKENPSYLETTKLVLENENCTLLSTRYMSTGMNADGTYRKVVIGLKVMQEDETERYLDQLFSLEAVEGRIQLEQEAKAGKDNQQVSIKVRYQTYAGRADYGQNVVAVSGCILLLTLILLLILQTSKTESANRGQFLVLPRLSLAFHRSYSFRLNLAARKLPIQHNNLELLDIFMPAIQFRADSLLENEQQAFRQEEGCSICLVGFVEEEKVRVTPCRHLFHQDCIDAWCRSSLSCPICRRRLDFPRCLAEAE